MQEKLVIAIDGPAASGKGTIARKLAEIYNINYLDTGLLYRAVGKEALDNNINEDDENSITKIAENLNIENLSDRRDELMGEGIGRMASIVSAIKGVRTALLNLQRDFAVKGNGAVLDGRDIGTVICPNAKYKFYISADIETRAKRRYKQLQNNDNSVIYAQILADLQKRDERDMKRSIAPLHPADDAIIIDTSNLSVTEVLEKIVKSIKI